MRSLIYMRAVDCYYARVRHFLLLIWGLVAILGAVALAFVTGLINPHEKVNGLWLVVAAVCIYVLAFRFYAAGFRSTLLS